jgi:Glycosyl transferases group 1
MDRPGRPVLELLVGPRVPAGVEGVLVCAARSCAPRARVAGRPGDDAVAARFATSLDAPGLDTAVDDASVPLAVVVDGAFADPAVLDRADVVLAPAGVPVPLGEGSRAGIVRRLPQVDPWRHRPVPPFVRAGWRRRLGFPDDFVVTFGYDAGTRVTARTVPTVLALASAAAVRGEHAALALALALGTPAVTDAATAEALGATDGDEVVVAGSDHDARAAAEELAGRPSECARLGRRGRELVERRHDPEVVARALLAGLGLEPAPAAGTGSAVILEAACRELGLPPDGSLYAHRLLIAGRMERVPQ